MIDNGKNGYQLNIQKLLKILGRNLVIILLDFLIF